MYNMNILSHDVPSWSNIKPCIKFDKPLVVHIFVNISNNNTYIFIHNFKYEMNYPILSVSMCIE